MESCIWKDGALENGQLTNYVIPTSDDLPAIRVEFLEEPSSNRGDGAKGIGELPMDGGAPAVINAIAAATGVDPRSVPLTPESLMDLMVDT
jgi:CO/xanthine dehydrogenase Mo-binding subunit